MLRVRNFNVQCWKALCYQSMLEKLLKWILK